MFSALSGMETQTARLKMDAYCARTLISGLSLFHRWEKKIDDILLI